MDAQQVLVTDVDGDIQAQIAGEGVRFMLDRLGARAGASQVRAHC